MENRVSLEGPGLKLGVQNGVLVLEEGVLPKGPCLEYSVVVLRLLDGDLCC